MTASAQGKDVSSYQPALKAADLRGLSFAFCKATNGASGTDPEFAVNWAEIKAAGLVRGAYHELVPSDDLASQIAHFILTVHSRGLDAGDMLAIVASDYAGTTTEMVEEACAHAQALAGPHVAVLVYSDLSVTKTLTTCTSYPLWLAWYSDTPPASVAPWPRWTFWQWSDSPGDRDAFNGTTADLDSWIAGYTGWTFPAPAGLHVVKQTGDGYSFAWDAVTGPSGQKPTGYSAFTYDAAGTLVNHQTATGLSASEYGPDGKGLAAGRYETHLWADGAPVGPPHATLTVTLTR